MNQERRQTVLRRLHSLSGICPVGTFLLVHLLINSLSLQGAEAYNGAAVRLNRLPFLPVIEAGLIGLPILFHAVLGVVIAFEGRARIEPYPAVRRALYMVQRASGLFLVVFIVVHVALTRFSGTPPDRLFEHMASYLHSPVIFAFYVCGVLAVSFHFGNGIWGFLVTWGWLRSSGARRIMTWLSLGVSAVLSLVGVYSLLGFLGDRTF